MAYPALLLYFSLFLINIVYFTHLSYWRRESKVKNLILSLLGAAFFAWFQDDFLLQIVPRPPRQHRQMKHGIHLGGDASFGVDRPQLRTVPRELRQQGSAYIGHGAIFSLKFLKDYFGVIGDSKICLNISLLIPVIKKMIMGYPVFVRFISNRQLHCL